jgi:hypothetical protein
MPTIGFPRFNKQFASGGIVTPLSDAQAVSGWAFLGSAPPTVEEFNAMMQTFDDKDNWLFGNIQTLITNAGSAAAADGDFTALYKAITAMLQKGITGVLTGSATAYLLANSQPVTAYVNGQKFRAVINVLNGVSPTIAIDGLAAIPIYGLGATALQSGEMPLNSLATFEILISPSINAGAPVAVLQEAPGGAAQIGPGTASNHATQYGQLPGTVGACRNLQIDIPIASASALITADEFQVSTALGGLRTTLKTVNATCNISTVGLNGMDIAGLPATANVAIYVIYNPTTKVTATLGFNPGAAKAPEVYAGTAMPAGFTYSALAAVLLVQTSLFVVCYVQDRHVTLNQINQSTGTSPVTNQLLSLGCPLNAKNADINVVFTSTSATNANVGIGATSTGTLGTSSFQVAGGSGSGSMYLRKFGLRTGTSIWFSFSNSAGTPNLAIALTGYDI